MCNLHAHMRLEHTRYGSSILCHLDLSIFCISIVLIKVIKKYEIIILNFKVGLPILVLLGKSDLMPRYL